MAATPDHSKFSDVQDVSHRLLRTDITFQESQLLYSKWAQEGTYDQMIDDNAKDYNGLIKFTEGVKTLFSDVTAVRVLDLGAGTGLSGNKLRSVGYTNIDALEPCASFVEICKKKGIYDTIITTPIGGDTPLDVPDNTYDAVCTVGCFGPGHIPSSAIPELFRILKPGGLFLNCMRAEFLDIVPDYRDNMVPLLADMEKQGRIQKVEWTVYPEHYISKDGIRMVLKKL